MRSLPMLLSLWLSIEIPNHNDTDDGKKFVSLLRDDARIIGSSLHFIDEFLRSMLDAHASSNNRLTIKLALADLLTDVLGPVCGILRQRDSGIDVSVDCPENLVVMTDCLRLKQVLMNLGRNSIKFTTHGFLRLRAAVVDGLVVLHIEDSGGGIPEEKRGAMSETFQLSLDVLSQGTGIGLSLSENLTHLLNGEISLDETYNSGVEGSPGASFVVNLKRPPLSVEAILTTSKRTEIGSEPAGTEEATGEQLAEKLTILFVDDDIVLRKLFARAVKKVAPIWTFSEAASGEAALQLIETGTYDLIFMYQYMASTDKQFLGTETVQALRKIGIESIICGLSANNIGEAFLAAGSDCFVLKPFPCESSAMKRKLLRITGARTVRHDE